MRTDALKWWGCAVHSHRYFVISAWTLIAFSIGMLLAWSVNEPRQPVQWGDIAYDIIVQTATKSINR
jgi:hypothetical protein